MTIDPDQMSRIQANHGHGPFFAPGVTYDTVIVFYFEDLNLGPCR